MTTQPVSPGFYPVDVIAKHLHRLHRDGAGMPYVVIAERAEVGLSTIKRVAWGTDIATVRRSTGARILAVEYDPTTAEAVDPTAALRKLDILQLEQWPLSYLATQLGCNKQTIVDWRRRRTIPGSAAADVDLLYRRLNGKVGPSSHAAAKLRGRGALERRYFSDTNIDDPRYDPHAPMREPIGVRRMLRALAAIGHGPADLADELSEPDPSTVEKWQLDGVVPAYARHLVEAVFDRLAWTPGHDVEATDRAIHAGWLSPAAWIDVDVHRPKARPKMHAAGPRKTDVLVSVLYDALDGRITHDDMTIAERVYVVTVLHARGWSDAQVGELLHWGQPDADDRTGNDAVMQFRRYHNIGVTRRPGRQRVLRLVVCPRAARRRAIARQRLRPAGPHRTRTERIAAHGCA